MIVARSGDRERREIALMVVQLAEEDRIEIEKIRRRGPGIDEATSPDRK